MTKPGEFHRPINIELLPKTITDRLAIRRALRITDRRKDTFLAVGTQSDTHRYYGVGQAEDKELSRKAGFDHHLVKPVDPDALLKLVHKRKTATTESDSARL